jgi:hypothetical protein
VITLSAPGAGWVYHAADPFWIHARLPWLLLLPLLCGAQYGMAHGIASGALLSVLALGHAAGSGHAEWVAVSNWSLGCLIVGAIVGLFRDAAERRRAHLTEDVAHMTEALQRAQRTAHVLQLSHARLEERLSATRWSLVGSLEAAGRRMQEITTTQELGDVLLDVLASQAMVQSASLFWGGIETPLRTPVATLGEKRAGAFLHPLVRRARLTGKLVAVGDPAVPRGSVKSDVLAAVPLLTSDGRTMGVVAIHQMPFIAFQSEQLRNLLVIAAQLTDMMDDRLREAATSPVAPSAEITAERPSVPPVAAVLEIAIQRAAGQRSLTPSAPVRVSKTLTVSPAQRADGTPAAARVPTAELRHARRA